MNTRPPFDVDPRYPEEGDDLWDPELREWIERPTFVTSYLAGVLYGLLLGLVVGAFIAAQLLPAPRPAAHVIPAVAIVDGSAPSGNLALPAGASRPQVEERRLGAPVAAGTSDGAPPDSAPAVVGGIATWYDDGPGLYAAVPTWSFGDARYTVRVCRQDDDERCVDVVVRDFCACGGDRVIDLSPAAFARLAPLWAGVVPVTIESGRPTVTPPATSTEVGP